MSKSSSLEAPPEITGALLSSMLTSMQDLGNLGQKLLSANGVDEIQMDAWYSRAIQHQCFDKLSQRLGCRALYAVGFAYQNLMRQRYNTQLEAIEFNLRDACALNKPVQDKLSDAVDATQAIIEVLNNGSKNNIRHHPQDYGFFFERTGTDTCMASFYSFSIPAITPYCEAIIHCMLRMMLPPQVQIDLRPSPDHPGRSAGMHHDTFAITYTWVDTTDSYAEMRLAETLRVKENLLKAAVDAAEAAEHKAERALAFHMESVNYASRIQRGLLPPEDRLQRQFKSQAVLWEPRDLIGGDIYWTSNSPPGEIFSLALMDCTGHGVPGAMLSMLVTSTMERIYQIDPTVAPGSALARLGDLIRGLLRQDRVDAPSRDGLDAAICRINPVTHEVTFSGARVSLFVIPGTPERPIERIAGEKRALGYAGTTPHQAMPVHYLASRPGDVFVLVSDGIIDQIGQLQRMAFGNKRLLKTLNDCVGQTPTQVLDHLHKHLLQWQGNEPRRDDISAFAFTI